MPLWQVKAWVEKLMAVCQKTITGQVDVAMGAWVEKIGSEMLNDKGPAQTWPTSALQAARGLEHSADRVGVYHQPT